MDLLNTVSSLRAGDIGGVLHTSSILWLPALQYLTRPLLYQRFQALGRTGLDARLGNKACPFADSRSVPHRELRVH